MKRLGLLVLFVLGFGLLLPSHLSAQANNPAQVVKDYIATANTGDFDKTLAFYADDAIVKNGLGLFVGKDQIGNWLKQDVQTTRATPQSFQTTRNMVTNTGTVSLARFKAMGIDPVNYRADYIIENGKIRFFSPVVLLTPEQQAKARAASASTQATAATSGSDAIQVVKDYVATANTGDFDKTLAFYADNAIVKNGLGLFVGKDQINQWLTNDVKTTRATPQSYQLSGNTVVNTGTVSLARFKALGIDSVSYRAEYIIENGKIRYFSPVVLLTPEQQARVQAANKVTAEPSTAPQTGGAWLDLRMWGVAGALAIVLIVLGLMLSKRKQQV